jgi:hypothetical protein
MSQFNSKELLIFGTICLFLVITLGNSRVHAGPNDPPTFRAIPLTGTNAAVWDVNSRAQVCGTLNEYGSNSVVAVWDSLLRTDDVIPRSVAYALSDSGVIVGVANYYPAAWKITNNSAPAVMQRMILPFPEEYGEATAVNKHGLIVGWVSIGTVDPDRAFYVDVNGGTSLLQQICSPLCSVYNTQAWGVNNKGAIVGFGRDPWDGDVRPLLWRSTSSLVERLGEIGVANAINDSGVVVGFYEDDARNKYPIAWATDSTQAPILLGDGKARDINNLNWVVGNDQLGACLWYNGNKYQLGSLTSNAPPMSAAYAVNDCGMIVCSGGPAFGSISYLLVPEDTTLTTDTDGDDLLDRWELCGLDPSLDGTINLRLKDADPKHKDLYVELDAVSGALVDEPNPPYVSLENVVNAFDSAPVGNPDGTTGIHLHIDAPGEPETCFGEEINEDPLLDARDPLSDTYCSTACGMPDLFEQLKDLYLGNNAIRNRPDSGSIREALRLTCRYAIAFRQRTSAARLGSGEVRGNDFWICPKTNSFATVDQQRQLEAYLFMHELGHNLGLNHGGKDDGNNFKPNYYSVMNYLWLPATRLGALSPAGEQALDLFRNSRPLDYSRDALPTLNEAEADERGIIFFDDSRYSDDYIDRWVPVGFPIAGNDTLPMLVPMKGLVDWSRDGSFSLSGLPVQVNANCLHYLDPTTQQTYQLGDNESLDPCTTGQRLTSTIDWNNLTYLNASSSTWFKPGMLAANTGIDTTLAEETFTEETLNALSQLRFDCNRNGIADDEEITEGSLPDSNMNGMPDGCEPPNVSGVDGRVPGSRLFEVRPVPSFGPVHARFELSTTTRVELDVLDITGRLIQQLLAGSLKAGLHEFRWNGKDGNGRNVASGMYFMRLKANGQTLSRKLVIVQ